MTGAETRFALDYIRKSIGSIRRFVGKMEMLEFLVIENSDEKTYRAVKNCFAEIGESVKRLIDGNSPSLNRRPAKYWLDIYVLRCRIVHDFENLDMGILWETIESGLEELSVLVSEEIAAFGT